MTGYVTSVGGFHSGDLKRERKDVSIVLDGNGGVKQSTLTTKAGVVESRYRKTRKNEHKHPPNHKEPSRYSLPHHPHVPHYRPHSPQQHPSSQAPVQSAHSTPHST